MSIFESKEAMPPENNDLVVRTALVRADSFPWQNGTLPGERRDKEMSVSNCEPNKRGCHY